MSELQYIAFIWRLISVNENEMTGEKYCMALKREEQKILVDERQ
jgi:hypothetical protein